MITFLLLLSAQVAFPRIGKPEAPPIVEVVVTEERRPSEAVLKANYAKSSADVVEIVRMAEEAKALLDRGDHRTAAKKLERIEKRAKAAGVRLGR